MTKRRPFSRHLNVSYFHVVNIYKVAERDDSDAKDFQQDQLNFVFIHYVSSREWHSANRWFTGANERFVIGDSLSMISKVYVPPFAARNHTTYSFSSINTV
jgi:hypothetical protein